MNAVQTASDLTLFAIVGAAVIQDFRSMKISNRLIFSGLILSLMFGIVLGRTERILYILVNISFPVIALYLLYLLGILGAGDIKLFSVIGGFTNFRTLTDCITAAFLTGALISVAKLLYNRNFKMSLWSAGLFLQGVMRGEISSYRATRAEQKNLMHFSAAILIGLLIAKARYCL